MNRKIIGFVALGALLFPVPSFAGDRVNLTMRLLGTAVGYESTVPDIDGDGFDDPATCFDVEVFNAATGLKMGDGTDCLSNITPAGDGLQIVGTTYFKLPGGTLISRGNTSVQPTTWGSPTVTHITGAIPSPGDNSVLAGTGAFKGAKGEVRLSGAVNMSNIANGEISFDCLFIADISRSRRHHGHDED